MLLVEFNINGACAECPDAVRDINTIVLATTVVGGASVVACLMVVAAIVAHGRARVSMRDRIVVGMMLANTVYSSANAIPLNSLATHVADCGELALGFGTIRFGRAWWFGGKFGLVCFEVFILGASIQALARGGRAVKPLTEAVLHGLCAIGGISAFVGFYIKCSEINDRGFNKVTQLEVKTDAYNYMNLDDDQNDHTPGNEARARFVQGRTEYNTLVQHMLQVWDVMVFMAIVLWVGLRWAYYRADQSCQRLIKDVAAAVGDDPWLATRRSAWRSQLKEINARLDEYVDVAQPLELYVAVFVVFAVVRSSPFISP
jgi:hypothetical protein